MDRIVTVMCLGIPGKVLAIEKDHAKIDYGGVVRDANIFLVSPKVGDYVIVHAGFAIEILDVKEAEETLKLWKEIITD